MIIYQNNIDSDGDIKQKKHLFSGTIHDTIILFRQPDSFFFFYKNGYFTYFIHSDIQKRWS